jgi:hypothetical protein
MTTRVVPNSEPKLAEIRRACINLLKLLRRRPARDLGAVLDALTQATIAARAKPLRDDEFLYINLPREVLELPVMELNLTYSIIKALHRNDVHLLGQLLELDPDELKALDYMGRAYVKRVEAALSERGLHLASKEVEPPAGDRWVEIRERKYLRSRTLNFGLNGIRAFLPGVGFHTMSAGFDLLESLHIDTIGELVAHTETEFDALPWADPEHRDAVKEVLDFHGYEFQSPSEA